MMTRAKVFLLLGSNMGDKKQQLEKAISLIRKECGPIKRSSSIYETEPWKVEGQDVYYNMAVEIETTLTPDTLLKQIKHIEKEMGRQSREKWAPREIDIDILFFGRKVIKQKELQIPHPHMHERNFAILPMMEIAPDFKHPTLDHSMEDLYEKSTDNCEVVLLED
jgi:2-amino-4-hydroxy-6-hydroxymethyldihydropteridine diphosphokinase